MVKLDIDENISLYESKLSYTAIIFPHRWLLTFIYWLEQAVVYTSRFRGREC